MEQSKLAALTKLLQTGKMSTGSIIVYTMLQKQADEIAEHLQRNSLDAMSYHAGKYDTEVSSCHLDTAVTEHV